MDPRFPTGKFVFDQAAAAEKRRDCIAAISSFPGELKASMAGARLDQTYRDGGWTARPNQYDTGGRPSDHRPRRLHSSFHGGHAPYQRHGL